MRGGVSLNNILTVILVDILLLVVFGFIVYKAIQKATQKKVLFLEKEADDLVKKAKREAEATKKEAILEAKEEVHKLRNDLARDSRERRNEMAGCDQDFRRNIIRRSINQTVLHRQHNS